MKMTSPEQNPQKKLSAEELLQVKNEIQLKMMIDAGIDLNDSLAVNEWININSPRFNVVYNEDVARKYISEPTETVLEMKNKTYH